MNDPLEIIITTRENQTPQIVPFEALYQLHQTEVITTMMLLWNHNSYYVSVPDKTFIVNGGRKLALEQFGECEFLYRRRNQVEVGMNEPSDDGGEKTKVVNWIIGLKSVGADTMVLLQIAEDGHAWSWLDGL